MKLYTKEISERGIGLRFSAIGGIKSNYMRRSLLLITFPVMFTFNCIVVLSELPREMLANNVQLIRSIFLRWNELKK